MAHDVFISYSQYDRQIANAVCAVLEGRKIRCWIAPRDVMPGVQWGEALIDAITESKILILIFSSHSNNSPQVIREVERAVSKGVIIVPFRIEETPLSKQMEYFISTHHWLDAMTPPMEEHINFLADTILQLLEKRIRVSEKVSEKKPLRSQRMKQKTQMLDRRV